MFLMDSAFQDHKVKLASTVVPVSKDTLAILVTMETKDPRDIEVS